jgi:hypothetical protein
MPSTLFKTKAVKIDTLGEYLSQVRKQLNLDIKTVSLLTQIKPSYLEDLEQANYSKLPAEVYVRGFLKSLSQLYHIKEQILIDQYEKERGLESRPVEFKSRRENILALTPKTLVIAVSVLLALAAVLYVGNQIRSVLAVPFLEILEPASDITTESNSMIISGRAEIGADVFINSQAVLTDSSGQFTENLLLSGGLNVIEVSAQNKFGKISKITRQINSQPPISTPLADSEVNITISIGPGSAWVYIEADGVVVQRGTMLPGSAKSVSAQSDILVTSANAGSTEVIFNGTNLGRLGREGEVIRNVEFSN